MAAVSCTAITGETDTTVKAKHGVPGGAVTETTTLTAIDTKKRKATISFEDGSSKKFSVRPDIDLSKHKIGEKVVFRSNESYAISLQKP
jgi:Cu/Ag efflux protein CusF